MEEIALLSGTANRPLAEKIAKYLGIELTPMEIFKFANDNTFCKINENIRKRDIFIIQPTCRPVNDHLMELLITIDACKRSSAASITAVLPYFAYARSDKKDQPRVPITAKLVADIITVAGANRIITVDLHAEAIQGFFNIPVDHLYAKPVLVEGIKSMGIDNPTVVSPDAGGVQRARAYAKKLDDADLAIVDKRRVGNVDQTELMTIIGDVDGLNCVLVDDIIDTAGSLVKAAEALKKKGAKDIFAAASHAVFSDPAYERIASSEITKVFVTDSIPLREDQDTGKIVVMSLDKLLGETIKRISTGESVSSLFE